VFIGVFLTLAIELMGVYAPCRWRRGVPADYDVGRMFAGGIVRWLVERRVRSTPGRSQESVWPRRPVASG